MDINDRDWNFRKVLGAYIYYGRCRLKHAYVDECTDSDYTALSLICELREGRNGDKTVNGFDLDQIECILHNVCIY